jgi:hypothetical protein
MRLFRNRDPENHRDNRGRYKKQQGLSKRDKARLISRLERLQRDADAVIVMAGSHIKKLNG